MGTRERVTTVISTKGQATLIKRIPAFPETAIDAVFGSLRHGGPGLSLDEMDAAVAGEAKRRT